MGHFIPVLQLAKRLVSDHNFQITVFIVSTDIFTAESVLESSLPNFAIVTLPFVDISSLVSPSDHIGTKVTVTIRESSPNLRPAIMDMEFKPTVLIVDLFGTESFLIADEFDMLKYVIVITSAWFLAVMLYAPTAKYAMEEHVYHKKPLPRPGCRHVQGGEAFDAYLDTSPRIYEDVMRVGTEIPTADGISINTWENFDSTSIQSLRDPKHLGNVARVPVYPIGPLYREVEPVAGKGKHVMEWLDTQPIKSVLYVSFRSGGTLSTKQSEELALGLELSKQRFIWVFHPSVDNGVSETFSNTGDELEALKPYLPNGFSTRIQEFGLIVPTWAPQTEILAHPSIGVFLTHCGRNSTIESIMNGVPMIAWPLYAEHKMNATQLVEEHKVAFQIKNSSIDSVIGREKIAEAVRKIIASDEGESTRKRVEQLKLVQRRQKVKPVLHTNHYLKLILSVRKETKGDGKS